MTCAQANAPHTPFAQCGLIGQIIAERGAPAYVGDLYDISAAPMGAAEVLYAPTGAFFDL